MATTAQFLIHPFLEAKKRGETHPRAQMDAFVTAVMSGHVHDYQLSAWLMASVIQGLSFEETVDLTRAFVESGTRLDWSAVDGTIVDKHSTGGVGDKTSLIVVPLLAACGVKVVKLSGRGLGFTGGTIDKLEAIPGFQVSLSKQAILKQVESVGAIISSQTAELAPADGIFYAMRDVTATVDYIPLIAASVVSKKIATGAKAIVLDIKFGSGAFMKTFEEAQQLAQWCRDIATALGQPMATIISNMNQPLGKAIGNSLEVIESIQTLQNAGPADLTELSVRLTAITLVQAGICSTLEAAEALAKEQLASGKAFAVFEELVEAQHGHVDALHDWSLLPEPSRIQVVPAPASGIITQLDAYKFAQVAKMLGAGRAHKTDPIDLSVGILFHKKVGDTIAQGDQLLELYVGQEYNAAHIDALIASAITIEPLPVDGVVPPASTWVGELVSEMVYSSPDSVLAVTA